MIILFCHSVSREICCHTSFAAVKNMENRSVLVNGDCDILGLKLRADISCESGFNLSRCNVKAENTLPVVFLVAGKVELARHKAPHPVFCQQARKAEVF